MDPERKCLSDPRNVNSWPELEKLQPVEAADRGRPPMHPIWLQNKGGPLRKSGSNRPGVRITEAEAAPCFWRFLILFVDESS